MFGGVTFGGEGPGLRSQLPRPKVIPSIPLPLPVDQEADEFPVAPRPSREPSPVPVPRGIMRRLEGRQGSPPRGDGPWLKSAETLASEWEAQRRRTAARGREHRVEEWPVSVVRRVAAELWKCQKTWADAGRAALLGEVADDGRVKAGSREKPCVVRRKLPGPSIQQACPAPFPDPDESPSGCRSSATPVNVYDELDFWRGVFDEGRKDRHASSLSKPEGSARYVSQCLPTPLPLLPRAEPLRAWCIPREPVFGSRTGCSTEGTPLVSTCVERNPGPRGEDYQVRADIFQWAVSSLRCPHPVVDAFASADNALLPVYWTAQTDAFTKPWLCRDPL